MCLLLFQAWQYCLLCGVRKDGTAIVSKKALFSPLWKTISYSVWGFLSRINGKGALHGWRRELCLFVAACRALSAVLCCSGGKGGIDSRQRIFCYDRTSNRGKGFVCRCHGKVYNKSPMAVRHPCKQLEKCRAGLEPLKGKEKKYEKSQGHYEPRGKSCPS